VRSVFDPTNEADPDCSDDYVLHVDKRIADEMHEFMGLVDLPLDGSPAT